MDEIVYNSIVRYFSALSNLGYVSYEDVNSLLFLRPTESKTIFIQQMGRGLRLSPETKKSDVIILDFVPFLV